MKRKSIVILSISGVLLLIAGGSLTGICFFRAAQQGEVKLSAPVLPAAQYKLGDTLNISAKCDLPWGQSLSNADWKVGEGIFQAGRIQVRTAAISCRGRSLIIAVPLKSSRTGKLEPGSLDITVERPLFKNGLRKLSLSAAAKAVTIEPLKITDKDQLPLAGELSLPARKVKYHYFITAGAIVLLLLVLFIIFKLRHRKAQAALLPWEVAKQELAKLRSAPDQYPLAWCVAKLTDVVRNYLTARFSWPVTSRTTGEFFAELRRQNHQLTSAQIRYLEDFLTSADLIKFANLRPEMDSYQQAVERAEKLIEETRLEPAPAETPQKTSV